MTLAIAMVLGTAPPLVALLIQRQFAVEANTVNFATAMLGIFILACFHMMRIRSSKLVAQPAFTTVRETTWREFIGLIAWTAVFSSIVGLIGLTTARIAHIERELLLSTGLISGMALLTLLDASVDWVRRGTKADQP